MGAYGLIARITGALVSFPIGAVLGYILMLQFLIKFGTVFKDPHPSMQGFGYFMMSLASGVAMGLTFFLIVLTLPWLRPEKAEGTGMRLALSAVFLLLTFFILAGQGHALIFVLGILLWLAIVLWLTFISRGVLDPKPESYDSLTLTP